MSSSASSSPPSSSPSSPHGSSSVPSPPPFENKNNCNKCNCSFGLINRKHHCRNCGRTFCNNCSTKTVALPHYNLPEVRVCDQCYSAVLQQQLIQQQQQQQTSPVTSPAGSTTTSSTGSRAPVANGPSSSLSPSSSSSSGDKKDISNPPRRVGVPSSVTSPTPTFTSFSGFGRSSAASHSYDLTKNLNEQCRDAIKNGDSSGVTKLLGAGADPCYIDHTGNSLLHLAAMFDRYDIAKQLVDKGAKLTEKNPAGETPLDLAPPALQHKLQNKV